MACGLFWFLGGAAAATWLSRRRRTGLLSAGNHDANHDANQERLRSFGDAVNDVSDAALDTIVSTANTLKAKLVERRAAELERLQTPAPGQTSQGQMPEKV